MRRDQLQDYVDSLKPLLNLHDWIFIVVHEEPESTHGRGDPGASFGALWGRRRAQLRFGEYFWEQADAREQTEIVAHEMLHAHLEDVWDAATVIEDELAPGVYRVFRQSVIVSVEYATDQLAVAFAPFLPPPPDDPVEATA